MIDASVAVEVLLRTPLGARLRPMLAAAELWAPELVDPEVLAVLRREVRRGVLGAPRARQALEDLAVWLVARISHGALMTDAWALRHHVTAYDAMYVAAAVRVDGALVTADGPLARAPRLPVVVHSVR